MEYAQNGSGRRLYATRDAFLSATQIAANSCVKHSDPEALKAILKRVFQVLPHP